MNLLSWALIALNAAALAALAWRHAALRKSLDAARAQVEEWNASGLGTQAQAALAALGRPTLISIEILNPMELAQKESGLARTFGRLTPELVRRELYKEVVERLGMQLREQGVEAEVRLHNAP
jgi:hypothetical protein